MIEHIAVALGRVVVLLMTALVAAVTWQVCSRYVLTQPSVWTEELARFLLVWIGVLGASLAYHQNAHLAVDLLSEKLSGINREWLARFQHAVVILFALLVMIIGGTRLTLMTLALNQTSPALGMPMACIYAVIPIAGLLITLFAINSALYGNRNISLHDQESTELPQ